MAPLTEKFPLALFPVGLRNGSAHQAGFSPVRYVCKNIEWKGRKVSAMAAKKVTRNVRPKSGMAASYSGTPLPKKLGIRDNYSVVLVNAPEQFERKLGPLPAYAKIINDPKAANVTVLFASSLAELARDFRSLAKALPEKTALWIAWPKKTSGVKTDLDGNVVRTFGLDSGWVDYKVCAIDETWSGLCFARRKK